MNAIYCTILLLFQMNIVYSYLKPAVWIERQWLWRKTVLRYVRKSAARTRRNAMGLEAINKLDEKDVIKPLVPINYSSTVKKFPINETRFLAEVDTIRQIIGIPDFDVTVWLCSLSKIRQINKEERGKNKATDILSFPQFDFRRPEVFAQPNMLKHTKFLGDIIISPEYVHKVCLKDQEYLEEEEEEQGEEDRGVSKAMSTAFTLEERLPLLMIHGLLHLLGYDHETDEEWEVMTRREEEVIKELKGLQR